MRLGHFYYYKQLIYIVLLPKLGACNDLTAIILYKVAVNPCFERGIYTK